MRERADVVVIGGGVMGCSVALHLLEAGVERVSVVERDGLFEGTSAAGAGFLALWAEFNPEQGDEEIAAERYGMDYYRALDAAGHDIDFAQHGTLFVAPDESAWAQIKPFASDAPDATTFAVDPARVEELTQGQIVADAIVGGVFQPFAGHVSAPKVGVVMAQRLAELGGVVETRRPVVGLDVRAGRVAGVRTTRGTIECETVVLAAGAWSNELLRPLGAYLPTVPQVTSRLITEPLGIPRTMPTLFFMGLTPEPGGTFLWVRWHHDALLWGGTYSVHPRNAFVGAPLPERFDEVPIDGVLECRELGAKAARFMPALSRYRSLTLKHGAPCFTPDGRALVGPVPGVEGLFALAGDNEAGVTHGPGFGKALADHITRGESELTSLDGWRIDRFEGRYTTDAEVAAALSPDAAAQDAAALPQS